jgi:VWFA-related protein
MDLARSRRVAAGKGFAFLSWSSMRNRGSATLAAVIGVVGSLAVPAAQDVPKFSSTVALVNVTATVTDDTGRFVTGLGKDDFVVYEDDVQQDISQFSSARVPVSLGILLDTSGSMTADKMEAARAAIDRFIYELLDKDDELFFAEFADTPRVVQAWTTDRELISRAVRRVRAGGGTALYDAVAAAIPMAAAGRHKKKAILIISDGNDSDSRTVMSSLQEQIRASEVLVYALGIDATATQEDALRRPPRVPVPLPFPVPAPRDPPRFPPPIGGGGIGGGGIGGGGGTGGVTIGRNSAERVNVDALRRITDDTGGRAEIVRGVAGLPRATARIADELSRQYDLAYVSNREKDGRWHSIRLEVRNRRVNVRARTGYMAS